jgi:hypothetical protein
LDEATTTDSGENDYQARRPEFSIQEIRDTGNNKVYKVDPDDSGS